MLVGSLGRGIPRTWDPLWDSSGIHETCVGPHVTRDTHVGLVARGWLDCLVFSWVFNLACSSTESAALAAAASLAAEAAAWRERGGGVGSGSVAVAAQRRRRPAWRRRQLGGRVLAF